jgi:hypothetical protein
MSIKLGGQYKGQEVITKDELEEASKGIREDFILVFGLFASVLIFLSIEVQVFQKAPRFSYVVGLSLFLLGSLQMFVLSLHNIIKEKSDFKEHYLKNPILWLILLCFTGAIISFIIGKI